MPGNMKSLIRIAFIIFMAIVGSFSWSTAGEYQVDKKQKPSVKFISHAPLDDFEGLTDKIDGYLVWENDDLTSQSEIYVEVDLNSVDTGIGLRNRHMRENYLHTDKYPYTHYKGKISSSEKLNDSTFAVVTTGVIFIHGIEKPLSVQGTVTRTAENVYRIRTNFQVKLSDFNIEIPSIMFYKINETMDLVLDFGVRKI
jgi:polyisoprenoid-binding protein YceI